MLYSLINFYEATTKLFYHVIQQIGISKTGSLTENMLKRFLTKLFTAHRLYCFYQKNVISKQTYFCILLDTV